MSTGKGREWASPRNNDKVSENSSIEIRRDLGVLCSRPPGLAHKEAGSGGQVNLPGSGLGPEPRSPFTRKLLSLDLTHPLYALFVS